MLYDPKWEKQAETKADPFSLGTLVSWLEKQPAGEEYCYVDSGGCLLHQYYTAHGFKHVSVAGCGNWSYGENHSHEIKKSSSKGFWEVASGHPRNFGAALERARDFAARP